MSKEDQENMIHDFISDINEASQRLINKLDKMIEQSENTEKELREQVDKMLIGGTHE